MNNKHIGSSFNDFFKKEFSFKTQIEIFKKVIKRLVYEFFKNQKAN